MQAMQAYYVGMQYTIRNVPDMLDKALRERAAREKRSINEVAIDALSQALGLTGEIVQYRDLNDIAGTWVENPDLEKALVEQRSIDSELWQ